MTVSTSVNNPAPALSREAIAALPKVELHVHLDCCLSYDAVARLAPGTTREAYRRDFVGPARCIDLAAFLRHIDRSLALLQTEEGLRVAVEDLFGQFVADRVLYAEVRFAPLLHLRKGLAADVVVATVAAAVERCTLETGVEARVILCTLRHYSEAQGLETARLAERFRGTAVAALDLAADEAGFPLREHVAAFSFARERGIARTAHAGEARGAESVRETLTQLRPMRLGHGVRSVEDPALVGELAAHRVHLEVCPSCNVQIGLFPSHAAHPVDRLFRAGVSVGINTDSRTLTDVTLTGEYERLRDAFGWGLPEFYLCNRNALDAAFLDDAVHARLMERLEAGYAPDSAAR
ncbi:MAG: adenosine deaminase [Acidobacteria bacterium]|nr:adenosine deaminase [Acidobacteriota bacterium]